MPDSGIADSERNAPALVSSEADPLTHAELLCLYQDAEENIRFAKLAQWRTTGGVLAVFVLFALLAPHYLKESDLIKALTILTLVAGGAAIYTLAILQSWQSTEREKIRLILRSLSSLAREVYDTKSRLAADIERFVLLAFLSGTILAGAFVTLCRLMRWFNA